MAETALEHRRAGAGEPLVAIHGIGSCWQVWKPVLPALEARHDTLSLSLPGYGCSAPVAGEPTVPALVDAVEEAMDAVGWDSAHIVGNSMGGWIAAELAARGRARTVVAISPAGMWTAKEMRYSRGMLRWSYSAAQRLAPHAERITATAAGRRMAFGMTYARPERLDPADAAHAIRRCSPAHRASCARSTGSRRARRCRGACTRSTARSAWSGARRDLLLPPRQGPAG